ncbi:MAG: dihydrodipicolinate synthase family protein [Hyphomicrobiales bacterium]|nr:dihydrodipicolinate synthase family protein [Hyphomicrobiales bacterium]|tara:strand:+ start:1125 stop:2021 length:897 start_codon:yes stop_codon:yes gene_type:complete
MIKGLIAPILSPYDDNLMLNQDMYNKLAKDLLSDGCSGLAPFGTTGEALSVSNNERMNALDGLIKSGIPADKLIPGTGLCNFPDTVELSRHAIKSGCLGVMTLPAFYFKDVSDEGLFEYYKRLIQEINLPELKIYLYHIPQVSGIGLSINLVQRLKSVFPDIIAGIKDSSGVWENTLELLKINDLIVYPGAELPVIDAIKLGGPGCISATANINPTNIGKVIELCHRNNWEEAEDLHKSVREVRYLFQDYSAIPAQKAMLAKKYNDPRWNNIRPPLERLSDSKANELEIKLKEYSFEF